MRKTKFAWLFAISFLSFVNTGYTLSDSINRVEIRLYGFLNYEYLSALQMVAEKYNIDLKIVGGCLISFEKRDSADKWNDQSYEKLEKKFGGGWKEKYFDEIDKEFENQTRIRKLIQSYDAQNTLSNWLKANPKSFVFFTQKYSNEVYDLELAGWGENEFKSKLVIYYKLRIFTGENRIEILSDIPKIYTKF